MSGRLCKIKSHRHVAAVADQSHPPAAAGRTRVRVCAITKVMSASTNISHTGARLRILLLLLLWLTKATCLLRLAIHGDLAAAGTHLHHHQTAARLHHVANGKQEEK